MNEQQIRDIVCQVISRLETENTAANGSNNDPILIETSARHVHLTAEAIETLFGKGAELTCKRTLSQTGEFLSDQRVKLVTSKGEIANVAVLGPARAAVQVEISRTDARSLGIDAPVNLSGDLNGAGDIFLVGENGMLHAPQSVIIAKAHIHMTPRDARSYGVHHGQTVRVAVKGGRSLTFDDVVIRVSDQFVLAMHVDFDEANACCLDMNTRGQIIR